MPAEAVLSRKEPIRGLKPFVSAALAASALLLSSCASVQLAMDRVGNARNTSFKPTPTCPSIEGDKNNATFFLIENTTSFKMEGGLTFKGEAYTNGSYIFCLMDNATNGYMLEKDGSLVAVLEKSGNGIYKIGTEEVLKRTNEGFDNVSLSDYIFGNRLGSFTTRNKSGVIIATPQGRPTVIVFNNNVENNGNIDLISDGNEYSQTGILFLGISALGIMALITLGVIRRTKKFDEENQARWQQKGDPISDFGLPNPEIVRRIPSPIEPFPNQNHKPSTTKDKEPVSLMDD